MGRHLFLREIAQGPFGPLYEARTETDEGALPALARVIVLPRGLAAAEEESLAQAAWDSTEIGHDGVLRVADAVFGSGWFTLVHDHSEGSPLSSLRLRAEERHLAFPAGVAVRITLDILASLAQGQACCDSLGLEWSAGTVAATSAYLCGDGRTRLLDGQVVAAALKWDSLRAVTGAVAYAAPEMLDPRLLSDERSDVFAVAVVLWELLTGKQLLPGSSAEVARRLLQELPSAAVSMPAGVRMPRGLAQPLRTALSLEPAKRFATRAEFASALSKSVEPAAGYNKVIEFTDVLLRRASTLFRLDHAPEPQLSRKLQSDRPKTTAGGRVRPRPPRAKVEAVPQPKVPRRPMVIVTAPAPAPEAAAIRTAQQPGVVAAPAPEAAATRAAQQPGVAAPVEKPIEPSSSLAQLRQTLVGVAVPNASAQQTAALVAAAAPKPTAPSASAADAGSVHIMTLLGLNEHTETAKGSPPGTADPSLNATEGATTGTTDPSEPPTTIMKASKLAEITQMASQDLSVSLAESLAGKPAQLSQVELQAASARPEAKSSKRTVQVGVTTLVLGFAATVLCVVIIMLLLQHSSSSPAAQPGRATRETAARARAAPPPHEARPPSSASQPATAAEGGAARGATAETAPASPEAALDPPAAETQTGSSVSSQGTTATKGTAAPSRHVTARKKPKKRYVPSDL